MLVLIALKDCSSIYKRAREPSSALEKDLLRPFLKKKIFILCPLWSVLWFNGTVKMVTHLVPLVKELDRDWNGQGHDRLLVVVQEQTGHYITRHLKHVQN